MMVIVKCEKCGQEYQLGPNDKLSDFKCECGGELSLKEAVVEPVNTTKNRLRVLKLVLMNLNLINSLNMKKKPVV